MLCGAFVNKTTLEYDSINYVNKDYVMNKKRITKDSCVVIINEYIS